MVRKWGLKMFKDYRKLNKLGLIIILLAFVIFIISYAMFVSNENKILITPLDKLYSIQSITSSINTFAFVVIVGALFFVSIKTFWGKNRNLLMMYRSRSYYLKMQFVVVFLSALVSTILYGVIQLTGNYYSLGSIPRYKIPFELIFYDYTKYTIVLFFVAYIILYYFIMYTIDIFANTDGRYKSILNRNMRVVGFIVRCIAIIVLTYYFTFSADIVGPLGNNPATQLMNFNFYDSFGFMVGSAFVLMILLVIEYMCYFKKKVIV